MTTLQYDPHPWNADFVWHSPAPPYRYLSAEQAGFYDENGYLVIERLVDDETLGRVRAETDGYEAVFERYLRGHAQEARSIIEAGAITFTGNLITKSPLLREFALGPIFAGLCADLVGPDVNMHHEQAVYKKPEKPRRFPWHQDNGYTYAIDPHQFLTVWLALTDATAANGCPYVVPGIHRAGPLRHRFADGLGFECFTDPPGAVAAEVPAGGAVVFTSLMTHMTGPNTTDGVRKAYILHYGPADQGVLQGTPDAGSPTGRILFADLRPAGCSMPVLRGGELVRRSDAAR